LSSIFVAFEESMTLSPDVVRAEVARFWNAFASKSFETLEDFYAHESSVFGSTSNRPEPGRLAAKRREREYFSKDSILRSQIGMVDVVMLSEVAAIACYTFQFHATNIAARGPHKEEHIGVGRATQIFGVDPSDQKIRIFHEHLSMPAIAS
jgi:hypothetical protein